MLKRIIIISLFFSFLLAEKRPWATTRFEKFWFNEFKTMIFRDPFTFTPINFKIGYYQYGGNQYWDQWEKVFKGEELLKTSPFVFSNSNNLFSDIDDNSNRKTIVAELDLFKYNFFHKAQNIIDIQFGFGYKISKSLKRIPDVINDVNVFYKPLIQEYNINTTFIFQWKPKRYYSLFYSVGHVNVDIYESSLGYATGTGISQSFGLGLNFIRPRYMKNNSSHYGFEIRFDKYNIDEVEDPLNNIKSFKIKKIGILYSFAIGYGGKKSLGDDAYFDMLNGDYISAVEKFQHFKGKNKIRNRKEDIEEMLQFSIRQMPYQMYDNAIKEFNLGFHQQSLWWLNKANEEASEELKEMIKEQKILVITDLLKSHLVGASLDEELNVLMSINKYDSSNVDLTTKIGTLLIEKGDIYARQDKLFEAYVLYLEALFISPLKKYVVDLKLSELTVRILNNAYIFLQNNENVIAYELLFLVSEFSNKEAISDALYKIADGQLGDYKIAEFRERLQNILYGDGTLNIANSKILLGDHYTHVIDVLGEPINKINKRKRNYSYSLETFVIDETKYKLFFKNRILIDVERMP